MVPIARSSRKVKNLQCGRIKTPVKVSGGFLGMDFVVHVQKGQEFWSSVLSYKVGSAHGQVNPCITSAGQLWGSNRHSAITAWPSPWFWPSTDVFFTLTPHGSTHSHYPHIWVRRRKHPCGIIIHPLPLGQRTQWETLTLSLSWAERMDGRVAAGHLGRWRESVLRGAEKRIQLVFQTLNEC